MDFLFLYGTPDDGRCTGFVDKHGKLKTAITGSSNAGPFLKKLPGRKHTFYMSGGGGSQPYSFNFVPSVIFSELSDPDSHTVALQRAASFCDKQQRPVFNHPRAVQLTRRDHIYERLKDIDGLSTPKTIRFRAKSPDDVARAIRDGEVSYPVIFRKAGDHGGISTTLLENEEQIVEAMYPYALDGTAFYATEFVDFKSSDGHYRKYRIAVVEGKPYLRHVIISNSWLIHSSSREFMKDNPALQQEEADAIAHFDERMLPVIQETVHSITQVLQLDYYGIDCNIDEDGNILAFEINANMNILINNQPSPNIWEQPIERIARHITDLVMRKAQKVNAA